MEVVVMIYFMKGTDETLLMAEMAEMNYTVTLVGTPTSQKKMERLI